MNGNHDLIMGGREATTCKGKEKAHIKTLRQKQAWYVEGNINGQKVCALSYPHKEG